jgi:hypothetical protein
MGAGAGEQGQRHRPYEENLKEKDVSLDRQATDLAR